MSTGYEWLRRQEESGVLTFLLTKANAPWRFRDVARVADAGEIDIGRGEKLISCIVQTTDHRRYQLRAWRAADGTIGRAQSEQLPGPI